MTDRIITIAAIALGFAVVAAPAFAQVQRLPEPATLSLFGLGVGGAYIAKRLMGRK